MAESVDNSHRFSFKTWPGGMIIFLRRRWWGITLLVGLILVLGYEYHWFRPEVPPPFDVDEFLAPEYFGKDRAPAAYQKVFAKIDKLDESVLNALHYYGEPSWYEIIDKPKPKDDPDELLSISEEIAKELIEAGKLKPGAWRDHRISSGSNPEVIILREAGRLMSGRAKLLLDRGQPDEALKSIIASLQMGRHYVFRGDFTQYINGAAIEWLPLNMLGQWMEHESVSPEMILEALDQIRELQPQRPTISEILQADSLEYVKYIKNPVLYIEHKYWDNTKARQIYEKVVLRFTARSTLMILNVVVTDQLMWCETPAWERRGWTFTTSGPSHLEPKVPGSNLTRTRLDTAIGRSGFLSDRVSYVEPLWRTYDRQTAVNALVETRAALIAYRKRTGSYPERLEELVPDYLPKLPLDPYSGKPLILAVAEQEMFAEADLEYVDEEEEQEQEAIFKAGQKVLYSIGEEKLNMGALGWLNEYRIDCYIFPLPVID